MRKAFLYIIISCLSVLFITGCNRVRHTVVEGRIGQNTTWNREQSPILLRGDVFVEPGVTLTVNPGVVIHFEGNNWFTILGKLDARGTDTEPIIVEPFRQMENYDHYRGIKLSGDSTGTGSQLKYVKVNKAQMGIYMDGSNADINHCTFTNCQEGVHLWNSKSKVYNNEILNNSDVGIYSGGGAPVIYSNRIEGSEVAVAFEYDSQPQFYWNNIGIQQTTLLTVDKSSKLLNLSNNWWGTKDLTIISPKIKVLNDANPLNLIQLVPVLDNPHL